MRWWHVDAVLAIERAVFAPAAWTPEQLVAELAGVPDRRHYVVAVDVDGAVLGYAGMSLVGDTADVMTVAVAEQARGHGAGRALVRTLLATAAERSVHEVFLEVGVDNAAAIGLYSGLGFDRLSRRRDYYGPGVDALVMRRRRLHREEWATP